MNAMSAPATGDRWIATVRSIAYLVTGALLALAAIVLILPATAYALAGRTFRTGRDLVDWERRRVGIVLRRLIPIHHHLGPWRLVAWLGWQILIALPVSLAMTYLLIGGINALTFPFWWTVLGTPNASPLPGIEVQAWSTAALIPLIGLAYEAALIGAGPWVGPRIATGSLRVLGLAGAPYERDRVVNASRGAELRRIDRAIHDGVQAHLVNANMLVGIARHDTTIGSTAGEHLRTASAEITTALAELRTVIDTLYPPVLADQGLESAIRQLAGHTHVTTRVRCGRLGNVPPEIEAATYYGVAEVLSNAVRHSGCTRIDIILERDPDRLMCTMIDNGHGGATIPHGAGPMTGSTGLAGLQARVNEFAGRLQIHSPAGGPTRISLELPCVS